MSLLFEFQVSLFISEFLWRPTAIFLRLQLPLSLQRLGVRITFLFHLHVDYPWKRIKATIISGRYSKFSANYEYVLYSYRGICWDFLTVIKRQKEEEEEAVTLPLFAI